MRKYILSLIIIIFLISIIYPQNHIENIYLITVDTLRADHVGCYGNNSFTTPFIDSLARKGIIFKKAYSASGTTCPSHASIFTGLYPSQHSVLANGYQLDDSYITLAEILRANGYKTAAFVSTDSQFIASNFNQGFDYFNEPEKFELKNYQVYRLAQYTIEKSIKWINKNKQKKHFVWIHLFDPHIPYTLHKDIKNTLGKQTDHSFLKNIISKKKVNLEIFGNSLNNYLNYILSYNSEIRYIDNELNKVITRLKEYNINKKSLLLLTADHGEALGQHNWLGHGKYLYNEILHIPLIFYFFDESIKNKSINTLVGNIQVFNTILDLLHLNKDMKKNFFTKSLKPLIFSKKNDSKAENSFVISERRHYTIPKKFSSKIPFWRKRYEKGKAIAIQNENFKFIFKNKLGNEFYNKTNDINELKNLITSKKKIKKKNLNLLKNKLFIFLKSFPKGKAIKPVIVDKIIIRQLKSLGYIL
ncbi:MAG: sulfatase [Acidobacteriota bacterium]